MSRYYYTKIEYHAPIQYRLGEESRIRSLEDDLNPEIVKGLFDIKQNRVVCNSWLGLLEFAEVRQGKTIKELTEELIDFYGD